VCPRKDLDQRDLPKLFDYELGLNKLGLTLRRHLGEPVGRQVTTSGHLQPRRDCRAPSARVSPGFKYRGRSELVPLRSETHTRAPPRGAPFCNSNSRLPKNTRLQLFLSRLLNVSGGPVWIRTLFRISGNLLCFYKLDCQQRRWIKLGFAPNAELASRREANDRFRLRSTVPCPHLIPAKIIARLPMVNEIQDDVLRTAACADGKGGGPMAESLISSGRLLMTMRDTGPVRLSAKRIMGLSQA
jgi:hypothetical protein